MLKDILYMHIKSTQLYKCLMFLTHSSNVLRRQSPVCILPECSCNTALALLAVFLFNSMHFYFYKNEILLLNIDKRENCL